MGTCVVSGRVAGGRAVMEKDPIWQPYLRQTIDAYGTA